MPDLGERATKCRPEGHRRTVFGDSRERSLTKPNPHGGVAVEGCGLRGEVVGAVGHEDLDVVTPTQLTGEESGADHGDAESGRFQDLERQSRREPGRGEEDSRLVVERTQVVDEPDHLHSRL